MERKKTKSIQNMIYEFRDLKVMMDSDLAKLYQVEAKTLNRVVKRNIRRFPRDFMFQLSAKEWEILKYQIGTSRWGGKRKVPYVFTEQGIAMLSGLLNSDIAIKVNIKIMRTFVQLRHYTNSQSETTDQILELRKLHMLHIENNDNKFSEQDESINKIIKVLNNLVEKPKETRRIGFNT